MDERTLKALKGSIKKWEGIVAGTEEDRYSDNCPLCHEFNEETNPDVEDPDEEMGCYGCPVRERTGQESCWGSPWVAWNDVLRESGQVSSNRKPQNAEQLELAKKELEFLRSLLPESERS